VLPSLGFIALEEAMRVKNICGLLLMGVLAACGGTIAEEAEKEQLLWPCGGDPVQSCPAGYRCDAVPPAMGSCRIAPVEDSQSPDAEVRAAWTPCEIGDPVCEYTNGTSCSYRYETTKPCCDPGEGGRQTCTCVKSTGKWMCPLPIY
jgi:hypothetical protein